MYDDALKRVEQYARRYGRIVKQQLGSGFGWYRLLDDVAIRNQGVMA